MTFVFFKNSIVEGLVLTFFLQADRLGCGHLPACHRVTAQLPRRLLQLGQRFEREGFGGRVGRLLQHRFKTQSNTRRFPQQPGKYKERAGLH